MERLIAKVKTDFSGLFMLLKGTKIPDRDFNLVVAAKRSTKNLENYKQSEVPTQYLGAGGYRVKTSSVLNQQLLIKTCCNLKIKRNHFHCMKSQNMIIQIILNSNTLDP